MDSQFKQMLDTLKALGIPHVINWHPTKEEWQQTILGQGYNITALACTVVSVAGVDFLFSNGALYWTEDERPIGERGLLMLMRLADGTIRRPVPRMEEIPAYPFMIKAERGTRVEDVLTPDQIAGVWRVDVVSIR